MVKLHPCCGFAFMILLCLSHGFGQRVKNKVYSNKLRIVSLNSNKSLSLTTSGILEIRIKRRWFRFCDSGWGKSESYVTCGQLGFADSIYPSNVETTQLPSPDPAVRMRNVRCDQSESRLTECQYEYLSTNATVDEFCPSGRPAIVACQPPNKRPGIPASNDIANGIRLRGGTLEGEGQVHVLIRGRWGGICANSWNIKSANAACRQLGFGTANKFYTDTKFGQNHGWRLLTKIVCTGSEKSLRECHSRLTSKFGYKAAGCSNREIASVSCHVPDKGNRRKIKLLDGPRENVGRVVVRFGSKMWSSICSDYWSLREAAVACRQMGLGYAYRAYKGVRYVTNSSLHLSTMITQVRCQGHEQSLDQCRYKVNNRRQSFSCGIGIRFRSAYVGVICTHSLPDLQPDANALERSIDLQTKQLHELECAASENCLAPSAYEITNKNSTRKLLRFTMSAWNRGTATYKPILKPQEWIWHECHRHYHSMSEFAHYDILSAKTSQRAAEGHKASFCLGDSTCESPATPQYRCTQEPTRTTQGISVGCTDLYTSKLDCQWIDITDVRPGKYLLRLRLNPRRIISETNFLNNQAICKLTYSGRTMRVRNCRISDDYSSPLA